MKKAIVCGFVCVLLAGNFMIAAADGEIGQIKVCRRPRIIEAMDGKPVNIPADGTYTGANKKHGDDYRYRSIVIKPNQGATLGRSKSACVVLDATLIEGDGKPVEVGEELVAQFSIPGFTESAKVVKTFKQVPK